LHPASAEDDFLSVMNEHSNLTGVVIADGQFLVTESMRHLLQDEGSCVVTSVVTEKSELIRELSNEKVSLLIMDPYFTEIASMSELKDLRNKYPFLKMLIITNWLNKGDLYEMNGMGISNIILKSAGKDEILEAISATMTGKKYYSGEILEMLFNQGERKDPGDETGQLTNAEMEIVRLISEGLTTKEIASRKYISFHTVITHRKNIFRKLGVSSVSELLMHAIRAGWINLIEYHI
jgi:DNA-binding NarL/FixJ family response regulator